MFYFSARIKLTQSTVHRRLRDERRDNQHAKVSYKIKNLKILL